MAAPEPERICFFENTRSLFFCRADFISNLKHLFPSVPLNGYRGSPLLTFGGYPAHFKSVVFGVVPHTDNPGARPAHRSYVSVCPGLAYFIFFSIPPGNSRSQDFIAATVQQIRKKLAVNFFFKPNPDIPGMCFSGFLINPGYMLRVLVLFFVV